MSRLYLDACTIIYLVEARGAFHRLTVDRLLRHRKDAGSVLVSSRLSWLECRVKPMREEDSDTLARYHELFSSDGFVLAPISEDVIDRATMLRAKHRDIKTPDAIHLATAMAEGAQAFLTGDSALEKFDELPVEILRPDSDSNG